jgi:hypothetical protein
MVANSANRMERNDPWLGTGDLTLRRVRATSDRAVEQVGWSVDDVRGRDLPMATLHGFGTSARGRGTVRRFWEVLTLSMVSWMGTVGCTVVDHCDFYPAHCADDVGGDTGSSDSGATTTTEESTSEESTSEESTSEESTSEESTSEESTSDESTSDESMTEESTSEESTGEESSESTSEESTNDTGDTPQCGWLPEQQYYFCGGQGVDPSMEHPINCADFGFPMVPGAPCNGQLNYVGCCDAMGDAWYCINDFIEYEICSI